MKPVIDHLGNTDTLVRNSAVECCTKWGEAIGAGHIINLVSGAMEKGNEKLREEALKWIVLHKDSLKDCDHKEMVKPLIECLMANTPHIRNAGSEVTSLVMGFSGPNPFNLAIKNKKPAE